MFVALLSGSLLLLVKGFSDKKIDPLAIVFSLILLVTSFNFLRKEFVSYSAGYFIIRGTFKEIRRIKSSQYAGLSRLKGAMPFSNGHEIMFEDGTSVEISWSTMNQEAFDRYIRRLIEQDSK